MKLASDHELDLFIAPERRQFATVLSDDDCDDEDEDEDNLSGEEDGKDGDL